MAALAFGTLLATAACGQKEKQKSSGTSAATTVEPSKSDGRQDRRGPPRANDEKTAEADNADIPTEEDNEEAAEKSITAANVEDEVAKLEKEIGN